MSSAYQEKPDLCEDVLLFTHPPQSPRAPFSSHLHTGDKAPGFLGCEMGLVAEGDGCGWHVGRGCLLLADLRC